MAKVSVEGIKGYGFHGCMEEEARIGQHYIVDVHVDTDFMQAAEEDDLDQTVDYVSIHRIVREELAVRAKLIETVGLRIARRVKDLERVEGVEVKVTKPAPPIDGDVDAVSISVTL